MPTKSKKSMTYSGAGVDLELKDRFVDNIQRAVQSTHGPRVLGNPGGFAGLFALNFKEELFKDTHSDPVLVGTTDGVGTKLKIAFQTGLHHTVGIDLVAMNVNDLIVCGATPLFFLDYIATSKLDPDVLQYVIEGIAEGCHQSGMALLGGETAEMPDFYTPGEYDLAGFAVGVVERDKILDGSNAVPGDAVVGIRSSGLHSNGYSFVRDILFKKGRMKVDSWVPDLGSYLAEELLKPTVIYTSAVAELLGNYKVKQVIRSFAHITGSGIQGNLCRVIPKDCDAEIDVRSWEPQPIFKFLAKKGRVDEEEMFRVFNMGIGFCVVAAKYFADSIAERLTKAGFESKVIGELKPGKGDVVLRM